MAHPIKAIIFDKDGTLFDFHTTWGAWSAKLLRQLANGDAVLLQTLAKVLDFDLTTDRFSATSIVVAHTAAEVAEVLLPHLPNWTMDALISEMDAGVVDAPQQPACDLPRLMADLKHRGLRLGVATNDSEAPAKAHLQQAGILDDFDFVAGHDSGFGAKPAAGQLLAFCQATEIDPQNCVMVGDSTHDLISGRAAGMRTIAVLTGTASAQDLAPYASVVLDHVGQIPDWLDR